MAIFTDGAYEPEAVPPSWGSGVVMLDPLQKKQVVAEITTVLNELVRFG